MFGKDFKENGYTWTQALCEKDSDSDGKTNGEELGDPDCKWMEGNLPERNTDLSHPGICEPIDDANCKEINEGIKFESAEPFDCEATKEPDVKSSEYRLAPTDVPAEETSYYCKYFDLDIPEGTKEHVIAYEPIIDNAEIMHHAIIYGCRPEQSAAYANETAGGPGYDCQDGMVDCQEIVFLWAVGLNGQCHPKEYGGLLGEGGYTGIVLELHWNNALKKSGMTDSSGMKLYHTPKLRPQNAAYVLWGPSALELPPGEEYILQTGGCGSACTSTFSHSLYVTQISPHMHYYGRAMTVTLNGKEILAQRDYSYDSPVTFDFDPPLEIKPGDDIGVNCTFTTTSAIKKTYFGLGTYDEMCFAITLVHPHDASVPMQCSFNHPDVGFCGEEIVGDVGACDVSTFFETIDWVGLMTAVAPCDPAGIECHDGCAEAVKPFVEATPCLSGKMGTMVRSFFSYWDEGKVILNQLTSCSEVQYDPYFVEDYNDCKGSVCDGTSPLHASVGLLFLLLVALVM